MLLVLEEYYLRNIFDISLKTCVDPKSIPGDSLVVTCHVAFPEEKDQDDVC
jgi:hypothetical protein